MGKYPSLDGLAISPYELGFTQPTPEQLYQPRRVEYHHIYHYGRWYDPESDGYGAWRQVFRNMVPNVVPMLIEEHNGSPQTLHGRYKPPVMPKDRVMIDFCEQALEEQGVILLHNQRRSLPPKIITPHDWRSKVKRYRKSAA